MSLFIVGDSQACGAGQVAGTTAITACQVGSHVAEWGTKIESVAFGPGDVVAIYLGSNDYDSAPDPIPILRSVRARGSRPVWIGPPRIRDLDGQAPDVLKRAVRAAGETYFDTRDLNLTLRDGVHPTGPEHDRWFRAVIPVLRGSVSPQVSGVDAAFWPIYVRDCHAWGVNPVDLANVLLAESNFDPAIANPNGCAGLNQICDPANYAPFTRAEYLALTASAQWAAGAGKFLGSQIKGHPGSNASAVDLYWVNFLPGVYKADTPLDAVIVDPSKTYGSAAHPISGSKIISGNLVLVLPEDKAAPVIRPAGIARFLLNARSGKGAPRWNAILAAIQAAEMGAGMPPIAITPPSGAPQAAPAGLAGANAGPFLLVALVGFLGLRALRRKR